MTHICTHSVRSYECDMYGHVNNAVYLNYLEYARMEFLKDSGFDYEKFRAAGFGLVVARVCIDYKQPALLHNQLTIKTTPEKLRKSFGVFRQTVLRGNDLIAEAEVTWFCVNADGRPSPMPEESIVPALRPETGG
jgi:acyl-CoA thioester hydrolase